ALDLGRRVDAEPAPRRGREGASSESAGPRASDAAATDLRLRRGGEQRGPGFDPAPPTASEPPLRRAGEARGSAFDFGSPVDAEVPRRRGREDAGASPQGAEHDHALPSDPWNRSAPEETPRRPPGPDGTPPAQAAPAHAWPEAAGASMSGMTSSWPEAEPRREPGPPREATARPEPWPPREGATWPAEAAPSGQAPPRVADAPRRADEAWPPRAAGTRPVLPQPADAAPPREATAHPEPWPHREEARRPAETAPSRQAPPREADVPPRADEAWVPRPDGARPVLPRPADDFTPPRVADAPPRVADAPPREADVPRRADEAWSPRPDGARPVLPRPADDSAPPRVADAPPRVDTGRAVFERMAEHAVRPAGLGRRFTARLLDSLVYAAAAYAAARPMVPGATAHLQAKVDAARASGRPTTVWLLDATVTGQLALVLGAVLLFGILYEVLPTARWGRTPGKGLLGVRVLATATLRPPRFGAALSRWLVYAFLGLPGSLACLANRPRRQAWHDKAAKTYVSR
ncbi:RDD family protein, partial [Streptomyces sp. NPDC059385]|uniref:RDD family protein n=1 Tax=Streptomyces sp. NPDC059385 TaxID=3346817 RepID=UPI0036B418BE